MGDFKVKESSIRIKKNNNRLISFYYVFLSIIDFLSLMININKIRQNKTSILFIHSSFIKDKPTEKKENFYNNIKPNHNYIYFSYDKYIFIRRINGVKNYNIGIFVKLISKFKFYKKLTQQNDFNIWFPIQNLICKRLLGNLVFIPAYSNGAGLSLVFNKYRKKIKLIEVQHGSVINYPPYDFVSELTIVDTFFYKTQYDRLFLENKLFSKISVEMKQIPQTKITFLPSSNKIEILYISSFEFNGFHPVFLKFIKSNPSNVFVRVRLHPRQHNLENGFINELLKFKVEYEIHKNDNWFDNISENCIIISPLSSVIEEAAFNNMKVIIIDKSGLKRFNYLINQNLAFFSENIAKTIRKIYN